MNEILSQLSHCVEVGKIDKASPYPPDMKGQDGADELAKSALDNGVKPDEILENALIPGNGSGRQQIQQERDICTSDADVSKGHEQRNEAS